MQKNTKKKYSNELIKKIKANVKIEELLEKDLSFIKYGNNWFAECPFCKQKNSLSVSLKKQFAHCFFCRETFDVYGYFQKVKGLSFEKAVIEVKRRVNMGNSLEYRKLSKASMYFSDLKNGKNPITGAKMKSPLFKEELILDAVKKIDWILAFLISDYFDLNQEKSLLPEEVKECKQVLKKILINGFADEDAEYQERFKNLFSYILELFNLIEENDCNLSGIVHGLK